MLQTMGLRTGRSKKSDKFRLFQQPARSEKMKSSGLPARFIRVLLSAPSALTLLITICGIDARRLESNGKRV
jgi:hypothetical protein